VQRHLSEMTRAPKCESRWVRRILTAIAALVVLCASGGESFLSEPAMAASKVKLRGYLTSRIDEHTVAILDDQIHVDSNSHITSHDSSGEHAFPPADLVPGQLVEAEGTWSGKHRFSAEKISVDAGLLEKTIDNGAYLQEEPEDAPKIAQGQPADLRADGEWLILDTQTRRDWSPPHASVVNAAGGASTPSAGPARLVSYQVRYSGVRRGDGRIAATRVELKDPAPADAYNMPHGMKVVRAKDPQTGTDLIEFRRGDHVDGRMKLFAVREVQDYVTKLGNSLLPPEAHVTTRPLEFRFFLVEDPSVNAAALPDGTLLINTGLVAAVENEAQLAFVLSHEIAHVLQVHYWREVHETRPQRIGLMIAGIAGSYFIRDLSIFLSELGMEAVVNGHQRALENQADRLGLQNVIERGYDPREGPRFMRIIVDRYGDRSTSKLWSNHDSSVLRGSFLTVQLMLQYPERHFDGTRVNTPAFEAMRDAMGPVKIE
jgi:hypothetical protein